MKVVSSFRAPVLVAAFASVFSVLTNGAAMASTPAVSFSSPVLDFDNETDLVGWQFSVNTNITVDSLGFYDNPANGISVAHPVGIYDNSTEALVLSGTVTPADPYNNWFNWTGVTPSLLLAGHTYSIETILGPDNRTWSPTGFTVNPAINYIGNAWSNGVYTLSFPNNSDGNIHGYFGPNFGISTGTVPEPATWAMLILGLGAVGVTLRQRKVALTA